MLRSLSLATWVVLLLAAASFPLAAAEPRARESLDFFETRIRPILVEHCYKCHNSTGRAEGGLALDDRESLRRGGDSGPGIVVGQADASLLVQAIRHDSDDLRMPEGGAKLDETVVADFVRWIDRGALDPRDRPPSKDELSRATSWEATRERRQAWWSFQPVRAAEPPPVAERSGTDHPVDRFLAAKLKNLGLESGPAADRGVLARRLSFVLTGLPPEPESVAVFVADTAADAYERLVDRLLASERFGQRWARHWMDWFRYAETHGSEGDPPIPHAWRYRDYLIRALNQDVSYDRLIREHVAGDLLSEPRIDPVSQQNESMLGLGHFRMVQHGYSPVDPLDEQVRFTENQIDVLSRGFLGLTVACARCHDHKFDPISQKDFYALYGILASCRPALRMIDSPERLNVRRNELSQLKSQIKPRLIEAWQAAAAGWEQAWTSDGQARLALAKKPGDVLHAWAVLHELNGDKLAQKWKQLAGEWGELKKQRTLQAQSIYPLRWDLTGADYQTWFVQGNGLAAEPARAGQFQILASGEQIVANIYPAGVYTHLLSNRHNGYLTSPRFRVTADELWVRMAGSGGARVRFVVEGYPRVAGPVYLAYKPSGETLAWHRWDMRYWKGNWCYLEIATAADLPVEATDEERSWFGISTALCRNIHAPAGSEPAPAPSDPAAPLFAVLPDDVQPPTSAAGLARLYGQAVDICLRAWQQDRMTDDQANFLGYFVRSGVLPNTADRLPKAASLVEAYRRQEAEVPTPARAPGIIESAAFDQPLMVRGNQQQLADPVPRRFLEAFDATPYATRDSGRLELAEDLADPKNPLVARVIVNRLWHHVFGRGLVASPDNFGRLGEPPSHPELLDYLATRFVQRGWSIKQMIRFLVRSQAFQRSSVPPPEAARLDPANLYLSHYRLRRLEAEAIRDSLLAVSGQLTSEMFGPGVSGESRRRSVYVNVRRNSLDPFLGVFDAPEPYTTRGSRDATNVPAQSLAMLNGPLVDRLARAWAQDLVSRLPEADEAARIRVMYRAAFSREPSVEEIERCRQFLADALDQRQAGAHRAELAMRAIADRRLRLAELTKVARVRLAAGSPPPAADATRPRPQPIARWEFDDDLRDTVGSLHGTGQGQPRIEKGALVLDGRSFVATAPLARSLRAKTFEARVELEDLDQRGGGVMSLQSLNGGVFDSIVYGEQSLRQWLAGSDSFRRTKPLQGTIETEAATRPVHVALVYHEQGSIALYRDGEPYGHAYQSQGPLVFDAGKSQVIFGLRHSPPGGNKFLRGRIERAALYDRALTADEVAVLAGVATVSPSQLMAAMNDAERKEYERLQGEIAAREQALAGLPAGLEGSSPGDPWRDLAHALFNAKEFIYVR